MIDGRGGLAEIVVAVIATAIGSLFGGGDAALNALSEARLQALATGSDPSAQAFRRFVQDSVRVLSRWLVGRIVCIGLAAALLDGVAQRHGLNGAAPFIAVGGVVVTYGTLTEILGTIARRRPERCASFALRALRPLEWLVMPLAEPLALLGNLVGRKLPPVHTVDARMTETQVEWAVSEGERAGAIGNEPAEMIRKVLDFKDLTAREVMVPRQRIIGIEIHTSLDQVLRLVATEGHSRYPVYRETLDNIAGLLYVKDLFSIVEQGRLETTKLAELMRTPVMFVSETQPAAKILPEMQARRLHLAIVSDEFGGTGGLITFEDILEEIVGDIRDEYDEAEAPIQKIGEGRVVADAAVSLNDLAAHLGKTLPENAEFESLGGLIVHRAGRVPSVGATFELDGMKLIVREADERRVVKVEIIEETSPPAEPAPATG